MHDHVEPQSHTQGSRAMKSDRSKLAVCRSDRSRLVGPFRLLVFAIRAPMACAVSENRFGQPAGRWQPGGALDDV
jgi:hypothetical protein